jgi:hypothetical protein
MALGIGAVNGDAMEQEENNTDEDEDEEEWGDLSLLGTAWRGALLGLLKERASALGPDSPVSLLLPRLVDVSGGAVVVKQSKRQRRDIVAAVQPTAAAGGSRSKRVRLDLENSVPVPLPTPSPLPAPTAGGASGSQRRRIPVPSLRELREAADDETQQAARLHALLDRALAR